MLKVYLDNTLQDEKDIVNISDSFETSIVREDGFDATSPILREKTDAQLTFAGAAYTYICTQRRTDFCTDIIIRIDYECDGEVYNLFNGTIKQKEVELYPDRCIGRANTIRDDSFSAKFRDYMNVEIGLYNTQTRSCETLATVTQSYVFSTDPANVIGSTVTKNGYDVLDTLQYLLNYITDNTVEVVSDYLTANKYAIFKGYVLHTATGEIDQIFPSVSFESLFNELRKKLNLYMAIEYDVNDVPYLRIEQASYFYSNEILLTIDGVPNGIREKIDTNSLFNKITVGSTTTDVDDNTYAYYPPTRTIAWQEETYTGCGSCAGDMESNLDLVSDYIISSNVIYEALNSAGSYNDDEIYLVAYSNIALGGGLGGFNRVCTITTEPVFGDKIYNYEINNETVLEEWGTDMQCIAKARVSKYLFNATSGDTTVGTWLITAGASVDDYTQNNFAGTSIIDSMGTITTAAIANTNPYSAQIVNIGPVNDTTSYFTAQENGNYIFKGSGTFVDGFSPSVITLTGANAGVLFILTIAVYTDNTFNTLVIEYDEEVDIPYNFNGTFADTYVEIITPTVALLTGYTVLLKMKTYGYGIANTNDTTVQVNVQEPTFQLIYDEFSCDDISGTDINSFEIEFKYPVCLSDYQTIRNNKKGKFIVNNFDYYLREIKYVPQKLSTLRLIGAESMCECTPT